MCCQGSELLPQMKVREEQVDDTAQIHKSNKNHELALTSSCRIAVSLSLMSSRSCSVMATSSSWLCIWFHSSWLQGDKHSS